MLPLPFSPATTDWLSFCLQYAFITGLGIAIRLSFSPPTTYRLLFLLAISFHLRLPFGSRSRPLPLIHFRLSTRYDSIIVFSGRCLALVNKNILEQALCDAGASAFYSYPQSDYRSTFIFACKMLPNIFFRQ